MLELPKYEPTASSSFIIAFVQICMINVLLLHIDVYNRVLFFYSLRDRQFSD